MGPILMSDLHEVMSLWKDAGGSARRLSLQMCARLGRRLASGPVNLPAPFRPSACFGRLRMLGRARVLQCLAVALCLALSLSLLVGTAGAQTVAVGKATQLKVQYAGQTRTYIVYVPRSLSATPSRSAVLMLHGNGGSGTGIMGTSRLNAFAESVGFVAVYPETPNGRAWSDGRANKAGYDDLGFILTVLDNLVQDNGVNASQVYIGGLSSGGFMAERMACEASSSFVAVSVVSALLSAELAQTCAPVKALPMVYFSGTADPVVPFGGANWLLSQPATRDFWKSSGTCTRTTGAVGQADRFNDGTTLSLERIDQCARPDMRLDFYVIESGGHAWPGSKRAAPVQNGLTSQEVDASAAMVDFFILYGL